MGKNIRINVTKKDIRYGKRGEARNCPIARACKRAGLKQVNVLGYQVYAAQALVDYDERTFKMPIKAQRFVKSYDNGEKVSPFSFTLTT